MFSQIIRRVEAFIRFVIYSNLWVALAVGAWSFQTLMLLGEQTQWPLAAFTASATFFTYNYQRYQKIAQHNKRLSDRNNWISTHALWVKYFSWAGAIISLFFARHLLLRDLWILIFPAVLSLLYVLPKSLQSFGQNLRDIPYIKIHVIAISWVISCLSLPFIHTLGPGALLGHTHLWLMAEKYLFVLAITIPFDIRDLQHDEADKKTIPQLLGVKKARTSALTAMALSFAISSWVFYQIEFYNAAQWWSILISDGIGITLIALTHPRRKESFYAGWLDGIPIFQLLLMLLLMTC